MKRFHPFASLAIAVGTLLAGVGAIVPTATAQVAAPPPFSTRITPIQVTPMRRSPVTDQGNTVIYSQTRYHGLHRRYPIHKRRIYTIDPYTRRPVVYPVYGQPNNCLNCYPRVYQQYPVPVYPQRRHYRKYRRHDGRRVYRRYPQRGIQIRIGF